MTSRELAEELGLSERTLLTLRQTDGLPFFRLGRAVRYSWAAVRAWMDAQQCGGIFFIAIRSMRFLVRWERIRSGVITSRARWRAGCLRRARMRSGD